MVAESEKRMAVHSAESRAALREKPRVVHLAVPTDWRTAASLAVVKGHSLVEWRACSKAACSGC